MRRTVRLDPDISAAVQKMRRTEALGSSEAVNRLARLGLLRMSAASYTPPVRDLGLRVDVTRVAAALEHVEARSAQCG